METTLLLVKPDGVQRGLVGEILGRVERRGLRLSALKLMHVSRSLAEQHYAIHKGKPFYNGLIDYIVDGVVLLRQAARNVHELERRKTQAAALHAP